MSEKAFNDGIENPQLFESPEYIAAGLKYQGRVVQAEWVLWAGNEIRTLRKKTKTVRKQALDEAANIILDKHTNNVGIPHPMAVSDAEAIRKAK